MLFCGADNTLIDSFKSLIPICRGLQRVLVNLCIFMRARFGAVGTGANKCKEMVTNTVILMIITPDTTFFTMFLKWIGLFNDLLEF
jgi:hypothetical protein